jgi:tetratricopeptide (TPR) repeat protein
MRPVFLPRSQPDERHSKPRNGLAESVIFARAPRRPLFILVPWIMPLLALFAGEPCWAVSPSSPPSPSAIGTLSGQELLRIGGIHDDQQHFLETLTYYELALSKFGETKQPRGAAMALVKIARVRERQGKPEAAYGSLQEALPILARSPDRAAHAGALLAMGRVASRLGRVDEARDSLSQAVSLFTKAKDSGSRNEALIQLGLLQVGNGSAEAGVAALRQAYQDAKTRRDLDQQLMALLALGEAYGLLEQSTEARNYYTEGLRLAEVEHRVPAEAKLRLRLAQIESAGGQLNESIASGKRALLLSQTLRDPVTEAAAWSLLADLFRKTEREPEAEEAEKRAVAIYRAREIFVHGAR